MEERLKHPKDLGETMVIAHAVVAAEAVTVLERAAGGQHIPHKATMRDIYKRLRGLDDGLPPVERTNLLSSALWP